MLKVNIYSFSYKKGIPENTAGNGGGYVFDCRGIHNPGRYDKYKTKTGRDQEVKDFLEKKTEIDRFLENIFKLLKISIDNYTSRGHNDLQISFGCTGGQHRSVYSADKLAEWLKQNYKEKVVAEVIHVEQEAKNWVNETY